jgi:hypothetical protein
MATVQAEEIERDLCRRRAPLLFGEEAAGEFVLPAYTDRSLVNVPATLGRMLGVELPGIAAPLPDPYWRDLAQGARRVIVVLLDALGYRQLLQALAEDSALLWGRLAARGTLLPLTSICPSTTATALATLFTGVEPLCHGLLGYELWLREWGLLTEMLALKPVYGRGRETLLDWGLDPEGFLPVPGLGALLEEAGVRATALVRTTFQRGALTRMTYRGFQLYSYANVNGLWAWARHLLQQEHSERALHFLYWGGIDAAIHIHGSAKGAWQGELRAVSRACEEQFLGRLSTEERRGTVLVMLADHGFTDSPLALAHDSEADSVLRRQLVVPYSGEGRMAYLHTLAGDTAEAQAALEEALGPGYLVCRTANALQAGLFGNGQPTAEALARLGHFVAIARGQRTLDRKNLRQKLRGRHGGLTVSEMLVPWLAVRLDS